MFPKIQSPTSCPSVGSLPVLVLPSKSVLPRHDTSQSLPCETRPPRGFCPDTCRRLARAAIHRGFAIVYASVHTLPFPLHGLPSRNSPSYRPPSAAITIMVFTVAFPWAGYEAGTLPLRIAYHAGSPPGISVLISDLPNRPVRVRGSLKGRDGRAGPLVDGREACSEPRGGRLYPQLPATGLARGGGRKVRRPGLYCGQAPGWGHPEARSGCGASSGTSSTSRLDVQTRHPGPSKGDARLSFLVGSVPCTLRMKQWKRTVGM